MLILKHPVVYYTFWEITFLSMKNSQNADIEKNGHKKCKHLFNSFLVTSEGFCCIGRTLSCLRCLSEALLVVLELSAPILELLAFSTNGPFFHGPASYRLSCSDNLDQFRGLLKLSRVFVTQH